MVGGGKGRQNIKEAWGKRVRGTVSTAPARTKGWKGNTGTSKRRGEGGKVPTR